MNSSNVTNKDTKLDVLDSHLVIETWWIAVPLSLVLLSAACLSLYCFVVKKRSCWRPTHTSDVTSTELTSSRNKPVTITSHREGLATNVGNGDTLVSHTPRDDDRTPVNHSNSDVTMAGTHGNSDVTISGGHSNRGVTEPGHVNSSCDVAYDVFICYSSKDTEWVGELVEELERRGFRCCVDYRDFVPGAAIVENIADAIYSSRKTIAVLSPDFLQSNWCHHELRQALTRVNFHAVVPVVYRPCDVPLLLKDRTYVDWQNAHVRPYFWDNLEKALKARKTV